MAGDLSSPEPFAAALPTTSISTGQERLTSWARGLGAGEEPEGGHWEEEDPGIQLGQEDGSAEEPSLPPEVFSIFSCSGSSPVCSVGMTGYLATEIKVRLSY